MKKIIISGKVFRILIPSSVIQENVKILAQRINEDFTGKEVLFIGIMNGAFMFASDLLKKIKLTCRISFLKLTSYKGSASTGNVQCLIGMNEDIKGKTVIVLEDIVDTGLTLETVVRQIKEHEPEMVKVVTLLLKPDVFKNQLSLDYTGIEIPNEFIVGYGLDYNGYGRNFKDIYVFEK